MPTPPYAKLRIAVNGGAPQTGAVIVNPGDTLHFTPETTVGWSSSPQWQVYSYPAGWSAPAGWSTDGAGVVFSTSVTPADIVAPSLSLWGKFLCRLIVNSSTLDPILGTGTPAQLVDDATGFQIVSATGLYDLADIEGGQFGKNWTAQHRNNLRTLDTAIVPISPTYTVDTNTASSGDVVVKLTNGHVQTATAAVLSVGVTPFGVATSTGLAGATCTVVSSGTVAAALVPTIGASATGSPYVGINAAGKPVRIAPTGAEARIGVADANGNLTVYPTATANTTSPIHGLSLKSFGAIPRDATKAWLNVLAWNALMTFVKVQNSGVNQGALVNWDDAYFFASAVHVTQGVTIRGAGGNGIDTAPNGSPSQAIFFHGCDGFVFENATTSGTGGSAFGARLFGVDVISTPCPTVADPSYRGVAVARNTSYPHATFLTITGDTRYALMSITMSGGLPVSGTTAPVTAPAALTNGAPIYPGLQITDGTVTWLVIGLPNSTTQSWSHAIGVWTASTVYTYGDLVCATYTPTGTRYPVSFADARYSWICVRPGTSGVSQPAIQTPGIYPSPVQVDEGGGAPLWQLFTFAGVLAKTPVFVDHVGLVGWPGFGALLLGTDVSNVNNSTVTNCTGSITGGGIAVTGSNANVCFFGFHRFQSTGTNRQQAPSSGVGFWDHSLGGCTWVECYVEQGYGPPVVSDSIGLPRWFGLAEENYLDSIITSNTIVFAPSYTAGHINTSTAPTFGTLGRSSAIQCFDPGNGLSAFIDQPGTNGVGGFFSTDEPTNSAWATFLKAPSDVGNYPGWHRQRYSGFVSGGPSFSDCIGFSGNLAAEGPGHTWQAYGGFVGKTTLTYWGHEPLAGGVSPGTHKFIRGNSRLAGDVFRKASAVLPGDYVFNIAENNGAVGNAWTNAGGYVVDSLFSTRSVADTVQVGTKVFKCTRGGASLASGAPAWASATTKSAAAPRAYRAGVGAIPVATGELFRPSTLAKFNGHSYKQAQVAANFANGPLSGANAFAGVKPWAANQRYYPYDLVARPEDPYNYFFPHVRQFPASQPARIGLTFVPSRTAYAAQATLAGRVFRIISSVSKPKAGVGLIINTGVEPIGTYTLNGSTFTTGDAVCQEVNFVSGAAEPVFCYETSVLSSPDGTLAPTGPNSNIPITWGKFTPSTTGAEPAWRTNGTGTPESTTALFYPDFNAGTPADPGMGILWADQGAIELATSTIVEGSQVAITSSTNATPIQITATAHGFTNGHTVFIDNHLVNTAANGQWVIANVTANTFTLTGSIGNGVGGATGTATQDSIVEWTYWQDVPTFGAFAKTVVQGTLPLPVAGGTLVVTPTQASYEAIQATGSVATTLTIQGYGAANAVADGQKLTLNNACTGGAVITVNPGGIAVPAGQTLTAQVIGSNFVKTALV